MHRCNIVLLGLALAAATGLQSSPAAAAPVPVAPPAATPPPNDEAARTDAQAALAAGNRRLKDGDVAGAIDEYRRAQTVYPPAAGKIEFNIAKAEESRGDEPAAAAAFERFLAQALEIPPEYREEARNELRRLSAALGALRLAEKHPGYDVLVDGRERGKTPLDRDVWVRPGRHVITLEQDHRVIFRDDVEVTSGDTVQVIVTIRHTNAAGATTEATVQPPFGAPMPGPAPLVAIEHPRPGITATATTDESSPIWKQWWFWAGAGAVVATSVTLLVLSNRHDCPSGLMSCQTVSIPSYPNP